VLERRRIRCREVLKETISACVVDQSRLTDVHGHVVEGLLV
jgi:hypothetical protein